MGHQNPGSVSGSGFSESGSTTLSQSKDNKGRTGGEVSPLEGLLVRGLWLDPGDVHHLVQDEQHRAEHCTPSRREESRNNYLPNVGFSKKLTCKGTLRQLFICLGPPPRLGFCLRWWSSNFLGSESGQIQSVELLQNMVSNRTQHPPPPHPLHLSHPPTVFIYCTLTQGRGWGELNQREG